jgi:phage FluMu gp28-like protein
MNSIPGIMLPYQARWISDISPVKVAEKSRRVGISWTEAADSVLEAAKANGMDCWYVGYNKDMSLEFIRDCAFWAKHFDIAISDYEEAVFKDKDKDILVHRINFASGFKIVALSSRPSNLRGKQGKVIIDEAAFHDDLSGLIKAAIALLMWGGRVVIISTHNGIDNRFNQIIENTRAGKLDYSLHRITLDDALDDGLYRRICLVKKREWSRAGQEEWRTALIKHYGEDNADEELFCIPSQSGAGYLNANMIKNCMRDDIPVLRYECKQEFVDYSENVRTQDTKAWLNENVRDIINRMPESYPSFVGQDFARSGDLSVLWPVQEQSGLTYKPPFVIELMNVPFEQQKQVLFYICDMLPRFSGGAFDARGNGQYLAEVARQEYGKKMVLEVMLSENWYRENMPKFKQAFEDKETCIPKNGDISDDHRAIKIDKGVAKIPAGSKNKGRDGKDRHGDSAIAHCLALHAARELQSYNDETVILTGPVLESISMFRNF